MSDRPEGARRCLTERQRIALEYLSDKMEANSCMVGEEFVRRLHQSNLQSDYQAAGIVLGQLRRIGMVARAPELRAWAITIKGRDALTKDEQ